MDHEERRTTLAAQHLHLRGLIAVARRTAIDLADGGVPVNDQMRAQIAELRSTLVRHLLAEEELLEPVLERIDAWGPVRLDLMRAEHAHQRAVLSVLCSERAMGLPPEQFARRTLAMLEDILADMDAEDRDLLDPKVLHDEIVQADSSDA